ncbi:MAG: hypothetical protein ACYC6M_04960 [Terriglobales bacterium]
MRVATRYQGLVVFDAAGRSYKARPGAFGRYGFGGQTPTALAASQPTGEFTVQFTTTSAAPDGHGDPQQTSRDFLGTDPPDLNGKGQYVPLPASTIATLAKWLTNAEAAVAAGHGGQLAQQAADWEQTLNLDAEGCVQYQNNTQSVAGIGNNSGRSDQGNLNYGRALNQLANDITKAIGDMSTAAAADAAGTSSGSGSSGSNANIPAYHPLTTGGGTAAATSGTIFGISPVVLLGSAAVLGAAYFLLRKKKPAVTP